MPTPAEKAIRSRSTRKGVLVPLLEEHFRKGPVQIENEADVEFLIMLARRIKTRERKRRDDPAVFSPSALGSCLRHAYLRRHHKELKIPFLRSLRPEPNFYFLNGNFLHLKWQFAMHKMEQRINDPKIFRVHDYEAAIMSKWRDHGGTADVIAFVYEEPIVVDMKGLNVRDAMKIVHGTVPSNYAIQLADYMVLWNSQRKLPFRIERALLLVENKGGPDPRRPLGLHETVIPLSLYKPEVQRRLEELRHHEQQELIPPPECNSTSSFQFTGCPFRGFCKEEVRKIERRRRRDENIDAKEPKLALPERSRNHRPTDDAKRRRGTAS